MRCFSFNPFCLIPPLLLHTSPTNTGRKCMRICGGRGIIEVCCSPRSQPQVRFGTCQKGRSSGRTQDLLDQNLHFATIPVIALHLQAREALFRQPGWSPGSPGLREGWQLGCPRVETGCVSWWQQVETTGSPSPSERCQVLQASGMIHRRQYCSKGIKGPCFTTLETHNIISCVIQIRPEVYNSSGRTLLCGSEDQFPTETLVKQWLEV